MIWSQAERRRTIGDADTWTRRHQQGLGVHDKEQTSTIDSKRPFRLQTPPQKASEFTA